MKSPIVFSLVRQQSVFMTVIMSLMTFLAVVAMGIALSIGTGVMRWNNQWDMVATVQVTNPDNVSVVQKLITTNRDGMETVTQISSDEMLRMMGPWISGGTDALKNYLPAMWEIRFKSKTNMSTFSRKISPHARFLTHHDALSAPIGAGWRMIAIASFVLMLVIGAIGASITYIAQNTAMLHKRELEILTQVGATDSFVIHQMQHIVAKICTIACMCGFIAAVPVIMLIISAAHHARIGLSAMIGISGGGWAILAFMPIFIIIFAIYITRRATIQILKNN